MDTPILPTKLYVPRPRANLVARPRLMARLNDGLRQGHRLSLLSAPAGFGKTTLAAIWLLGRGRRGPGSAAWLSLDEADNDPTRFFRYIIATLRQIDPKMGQGTETLLGSAQMPPVASLAAVLANDLSALSRRFTLVLDDYQLIRAAPIHETLAYLLDHPPPDMHLLIGTRTDPPLGLPRLRARGLLTEIRADDLRFTPGEAEIFLREALGARIEAADAQTLQARTEGWAAGLQLAALSLRGSQDTAGFIRAFSGSNRHVIDFLAEEVLARQPEAIQTFLLRTCILDRFCASLCDALGAVDLPSGGQDDARPKARDSQSVLEDLEQRNLFVVPLDDRRQWYRYHRLFADFLRTELSSSQLHDLHLRAARWFETQALLPEAVHHILIYAATTDQTEEAARIVAAAGAQALAEGALVTLLEWLDALPDQTVRTNGWLSSFKAWSLLMTGRPEEALSYLQSAEAGLERGGSAVDRGRVLGLRCALSGARDVLRLAPEALRLMGEKDPFTRTGVLFMLGDAQDALGNVSGAVDTFREAYEAGRRYGHRIMAAVALGHLALSRNYQGRRQEALGLCQEGAGRYVDARGNPLPVAGLLYVVLAELVYEANDLADAERYVRVALELGRQSATTRIILYGMETHARIQCAMGDGDLALRTIREAQCLATDTGETQWLTAGASIEARLELGLGDIPTALHWMEGTDLPVGDDPDQTRKSEYTNYIRVLLGLGRADAARSLLERLEQAAREQGRHRHLITIHVQQAIALDMQGQTPCGLEHLKSALRLAEPEGYVRAFLDEGPAMARLVERLRRAAPTFVDRVLAASGVCLPSAPTAEPLSDRELGVLRLLAAGLRAPEIGRELYIASSTVRSHVKHIYQKLDAHNRYEAVARARKLGLM